MQTSVKLDVKTRTELERDFAYSARRANLGGAVPEEDGLMIFNDLFHKLG